MKSCEPIKVASGLRNQAFDIESFVDRTSAGVNINLYRQGNQQTPGQISVEFL